MTGVRGEGGFGTGGVPVDVVVPTVGRPSLGALLAGLARHDDVVRRVILVDDRPDGHRPDGHRPDHHHSDRDAGGGGGAVGDLREAAPPHLRDRLRVLRTGGRGPAAARNVGWRAAGTPWVVTLDDDVDPADDWGALLRADLAEAADDPGCAAVAGRIAVPLPDDRRPTDWERSTAGLGRAHWATADMVFRVAALEAVCGFDERFTHAYREDADLALRLIRQGWRLRVGRRVIRHPVRPAGRWVSLSRQRGNADDALMRAAHGRRWRAEAGCPRGRLPLHALTVGTALGAVALAPLERGGRGVRAVAGGLAGAAAALVSDFAAGRILDGPGDRGEVAAMLATSVLIPPTAVAWRLAGSWRHRGAVPWPGPVRAVLFDRDGTLVHDEPYNGDPERVRVMADAVRAVRRLRAAGLRIGLVSNQSGIARGLLTAEQVDAVNRRVADRVGGFDVVAVCPHGPAEGCRCRKPAPGLVLDAAARLGVHPREVVVVGDIGADVGAARAAGARSVLVPTSLTRTREVALAAVVEPSLAAAADRILAWSAR